MNMMVWNGLASFLCTGLSLPLRPREMSMCKHPRGSRAGGKRTPPPRHRDECNHCNLTSPETSTLGTPLLVMSCWRRGIVPLVWCEREICNSWLTLSKDTFFNRFLWYEHVYGDNLFLTWIPKRFWRNKNYRDELQVCNRIRKKFHSFQLNIFNMHNSDIPSVNRERSGASPIFLLSRFSNASTHMIRLDMPASSLEWSSLKR